MSSTENKAQLDATGYWTCAPPVRLALEGLSQSEMTVAFARYIRTEKHDAMNVLEELFNKPQEMGVEISDERGHVFCFGETAKRCPPLPMMVVMLYYWKAGSIVHIYPQSHVQPFKVYMQRTCPFHFHVDNEELNKYGLVPVRLHFPEGGLTICDAKTWIRLEVGGYVAQPWASRMFVSDLLEEKGKAMIAGASNESGF